MYNNFGLKIFVLKILYLSKLIHRILRLHLQRRRFSRRTGSVGRRTSDSKQK